MLLKCGKILEKDWLVNSDDPARHEIDVFRAVAFRPNAGLEEHACTSVPSIRSMSLTLFDDLQPGR